MLAYCDSFSNKASYTKAVRDKKKLISLNYDHLMNTYILMTLIGMFMCMAFSDNL